MNLQLPYHSSSRCASEANHMTSVIISAKMRQPGSATDTGLARASERSFGRHSMAEDLAFFRLKTKQILCFFAGERNGFQGR